jgi:hypothetical protein
MLKLKKEGAIYRKAQLGLHRGDSFISAAQTIYVATFNDFIQGDFEMLEKYSKVVTSDEKKTELDK